MTEIEEKDLLQLLVQRLGHLEQILATSSIGLFLTTTLAAYTAAYKLDAALGKEYALPLVVGVSILYVFLSGYYYFMLTHFYATASLLLSKELNQTLALNLVNTIWGYFRLPSFLPFNAKRRQFLHMLNAALFPLVFSTVSILGVSYLMRTYFEMASYLITIAVCSCLQVITFVLLILYPLQRFSKKLAQHEESGAE